MELYMCGQEKLSFAPVFDCSLYNCQESSDTVRCIKGLTSVNRAHLYNIQAISVFFIDENLEQFNVNVHFYRKNVHDSFFTLSIVKKKKKIKLSHSFI